MRLTTPVGQLQVHSIGDPRLVGTRGFKNRDSTSAKLGTGILKGLGVGVEGLWFLGFRF